MKDFSFQTRAENLKKLKTEKFDLVIIGGGITGAGVARDAASRGLKVALVEAHDYAFGTSSRSSKLIHGGIRYLENFEFQLVFEALTERTKLFQIAPHLVHPLRFMIPLFKDSRVSMFKMGLGMLLYDALALFRSPELHERLSAQKTSERLPIIKDSNLVGSYIYSDAYMDDDRLVHETLRSANEENAICANYVKVIKSKIENNHVSGLQVEDQITKENFIIQTEQVVCTVGPWTDLVGEKLVSDWKKILRPTKGIHLTFHKNRLPLTSAVVMGAQESSRIVFAIPRHEMIIVGTTDTDFEGNPELAIVTANDVKYLLKITNEYFPGAKLTPKDIISSYVGVRPLVKDDSGNESKTSREHTILSDAQGFVFVAGGKYTTYRLMSEQIVDLIIKKFPVEKKLSLNKCQTAKSLNSYTTSEAYEQALEESADASADVKWLVDRYGQEAYIIINKYGPELSIWQLEALQAIHQTMCMSLIDFYARRVPLVLAYEDHGLNLLDQIAEIFKKELSWSNEEFENQKMTLINYIDGELSWRKQI
ncbi:MAG: glycerol-3-phosphate dehydrogenase/oxidase [Pseudobdellovibrio sp.]